MIKTKESVVMNITFVRTCARYLRYNSVCPLFLYPRNRSYIRVSATVGRLEKGAFYIFPGNLTVTRCRFSGLCLSLFPLPSAIPASLFSFANSIGESFASCAPTVRKLNERLQLCSPPLQPAMLSPFSLSVCLSPRNCLFYKFIIGTTLRRNCQTCSCLQNSFPWFTCARVSLLSIAFVALEPACWLELENFGYSRNLV